MINDFNNLEDDVECGLYDIVYIKKKSPQIEKSLNKSPYLVIRIDYNRFIVPKWGPDVKMNLGTRI